MKKKFLALLLVAVMVISLMPTTAFASFSSSQTQTDCEKYGSHYWSETPIVTAKAATCCEKGYEYDVYSCQDCDKGFAYSYGGVLKEIASPDAVAIAPYGPHTYEDGCTATKPEATLPCKHVVSKAHKVEAVEPTCCKPGNSEHYICEVCDSLYFIEGETIVALEEEWVYVEATGRDHTYEDGCTATKPLEVAKLPCGHPVMDAEHKEAKAPTCCEAGHHEFYACQKCPGLYIKDDEFIAVKSADLVVEATEEHTYKAPCKAVKPLEVAKLPCGHPVMDAEHKEAKAPTCCEAGHHEFYACQKCPGLYIKDDEFIAVKSADLVVEATEEHTYEVVKEQAPTCFEAGYVWKKCSVCGWEKNHEQGAATGKHVYETVKEEKATCTEPGYVWQECTTPGCDWEKNFETPALGTEHGDTFTFTVEANCTDKGVVKTYCQVCEALLSSEELPTNDNHFFYNGKCMKCGESEKCLHESGATYTFTKEANCSEEGVVETYCKDCEALLSSETLEKNGNHFFYNGVCQLCGAKDECKHDYVVVREQAADCTNPAYKWYKCSICGNEKNGEEGAADPKAHDYKVVKELAPTCIEAGYVWKKCSICGNEKNHEQGAATGVHTYEVVKELAPTCVEAGYVWKECSVCGWEKNHEQGEATGVHTWKKDVTEATCTEPGLIQPYCEICGAKSPLSAQTPALGHEVKDGKCTRCDYVEPTKPTEPEETTKPSEPEETTKPTEPEETTKPTEPEATTKPTEPEATTKPTEKPTEAPTEAPTTKPAETTKPADPALDNVPKTGDNTGMILATMTTIALLSAMAFVFGKKRSVR